MKTANGMDNPLAEWTLKDLKEYCKSTDEPCNKCAFFSSCECSPDLWRLEEKPKFTKQEIGDAKVLMRLLGDGFIERNAFGILVCRRNISYMVLDQKCFPSVKENESYNLSIIIGDSDD